MFQAGGILDKSPRSSSGLTRSPPNGVGGGGGAPSPLSGQHGNVGGSPHGHGNNGTAIATTTAAAARQQQLQPVENAVVQADYELEYRRIESKAQRDYYKQVFTRERPRYLELYQAVDKVSERFKHLEMQMRQLEHGSPAWKVRD